MNKIKNYRWHMIALVCFITVINYLDRTALGIAAPTIMETTGITKEQYSWIVSAFQLAYTLGQPIMGFFIDTVGLKLSFAICAAIWGLVKWSTKTGHRVRVFSSIDFPIRLVVTHHYIRAVLVRCNIQRYSPLLRELHR